MPYATRTAQHIRGLNLNERVFILNTEQTTVGRHDQVKAESLLPKESLDLTIHQKPDGRIYITINGKDVAIRVRPCFPWSYPKSYISLQDDDDNEVALIKDLKVLDHSSRKCLNHVLLDTVFVIEINKVISCKEEFEVRAWDVETQQGLRKFQTKRDTWPRILPGGDLLIKDVAGDLYCIHSPHGIDPHSRKQLAPFID